MKTPETSGFPTPDNRIPTLTAIYAGNVGIASQTGPNPDVTGVSPTPYLPAVQNALPRPAPRLPHAVILLLHNRYRLPGGEERAVADVAWLIREHLGEEVEVLERDSKALGRRAAARGLLAGG